MSFAADFQEAGVGCDATPFEATVLENRGGEFMTNLKWQVSALGLERAKLSW